MGIPGLLPLLKPIQRKVSLSRYRRQKLAIDGYSWLHKASVGCAYELCMGYNTSVYLSYFVKRIKMMKMFGILPYFVFDGTEINVKGETELKRFQKRQQNKKIGIDLWNSGQRQQAVEFFKKAVEITPEIAKVIIDYCHENKIDFIVAPFEADPQMVYLEKKGLVDGIIAEDSDLLVFGCQKLVTKLNYFGQAIEIDTSSFSKMPALHEFSLSDLRAMVCLAGCDYTNGIKNIGLITALKLVKKYGNDLNYILNIIQESDKYDKLKTKDKDLIGEFNSAIYSFKYQRVFCPETKRIVPLNDIPEELASDINLMASIGPVINKITNKRENIHDTKLVDHTLHRQISEGKHHPTYYNKQLKNREKYIQNEYPHYSIVSNTQSFDIQKKIVGTEFCYKALC